MSHSNSKDKSVFLDVLLVAKEHEDLQKELEQEKTNGSRNGSEGAKELGLNELLGKANPRNHKSSK